MDPTIPWEEDSDLFQLAIIARENIDIKNLLHPIKRHHQHPPALKSLTEKESENQRKARLQRNLQEQKPYDAAEAVSIKTKTI